LFDKLVNPRQTLLAEAVFVVVAANGAISTPVS